jgi:hypothetical protein
MNNSSFTNLKTPIQRRAMRSKFLLPKKSWTKSQMTLGMSSFQGLGNFLSVDRFRKKKKSD